MQFKKTCMEFEVKEVSEIKVLLQSWHQVLARLQKGNAIHERLTEHHLVNIKLDDRPGPEEWLVLQFIAPPEMLEALIDELQTWGLESTMDTIIPGLVTRCRLVKKRDWQ